MPTIRSYRLLVVCCAGLVSSGVAGAQEGARKEVREIELPANFERGSADLFGFSGTPGDRSSFRVKLHPDGTLHVETARLKKKVAERKAQLTPAQTKDFYDAMVKIVGETDAKKRKSQYEDGWDVSVTIRTDADVKSQSYRGFGNIEDISPEFKLIRGLINQALPGIGFPE